MADLKDLKCLIRIQQTKVIFLGSIVGMAKDLVSQANKMEGLLVGCFKEQTYPEVDKSEQKILDLNKIRNLISLTQENTVHHNLARAFHSCKGLNSQMLI